MADITICVADDNECTVHNCKRRHIEPHKYSQSYANFSLDFKNDEGFCEAYIGFGKSWKDNKLKIN